MKAIKKIRSKNNIDGQSKEILSSSKLSNQTGTKKVSRVANLLKTLNNSAPKVFSIATLKSPVALIMNRLFMWTRKSLKWRMGSVECFRVCLRSYGRQIYMSFSPFIWHAKKQASASSKASGSTTALEAALTHCSRVYATLLVSHLWFENSQNMSSCVHLRIPSNSWTTRVCISPRHNQQFLVLEETCAQQKSYLFVASQCRAGQSEFKDLTSSCVSTFNRCIGHPRSVACFRECRF